MERVKLNPVGLNAVGLNGIGLTQTFFNYYANLPVTLSADESAGLITSANATGEPYGSNLQPNSDMSGTSGTGVGDIADGWKVIQVGGTGAASKTANDYQTISSVGGISILYRGSTGVSITIDEIWLAECYVSGLVGTPRWDVTNLDTSDGQFLRDLISGYNRKVFTADATFTGTNSLYAYDGEGCTIHWCSLRKLTGPSSGLISEVNRTLMPNGTELMPNQVDRDFSGASAWANVDVNAYDETGDLTITASAIGQYCTLPVLSAPTTATNRYQATFDVANIVSTWTLTSFDGTQTIGTISADGPNVFEWTATTTGGYRIVAVANDSSGDFDNFTLELMQPTASLIERVSNVETLLIDHEPIDIKGADVARAFAGIIGSPGIVGDVITFASGENQKVVDTDYWAVGDVYEVDATISGYAGTGIIILPYSSINKQDTDGNNLAVAADGNYIYNYIPDGTSLSIYSAVGHDAVVTVNSIRKIGPRDLQLVKDGLTATMFWDGSIVDAEQTIDSSLQYNVIHSTYGDLTLCGAETIIPLSFGATIATGTLTLNTLYEVITTEANHFGTGVLAGDYFISDGTETCDANNTVHAVVVE